MGDESLTVELTHLEKLHADPFAREFNEAMRTAFPMMAAELRRLRKGNAELRTRVVTEMPWRGVFFWGPSFPSNSQGGPF